MASYCEYRTMLLVAIFVLVCGVGGNVNLTTGEVVSGGKSRMEWLRDLLDHHDWMPLLGNDTNVVDQCRSNIAEYVTALHNGKIWASKMFDASGQYSPNILFGSDYWLGSRNACKDLELKQYYAQTPPFPTNFFIAKINVTMDSDHLPQNRVVLVGQCLPASCSPRDITSLLALSESLATERAAVSGLNAAFRTLHVRTVPGSYNLFADPKVHIVGSTMLIVLALMVAASFYEGWLERKYRLSLAQADLELANNNIPTVNENAALGDVKSIREPRDKDLRRETCGVWSELLLSFSALSNGRSILSTQRPSDGALTCLHGIRFMSVIWVIMVHTYLNVFAVADNKTMRIVTERNFLYQSVGNASYCVDSFFFISGLLVTVLFLRTEEKKATKKANKKANKADINKNQNGYTNSALSVSVISQNSFCEDLLDKPKGSAYSKTELLAMIKSFFVLFFYRLVRLTPAYAMVIGINEIALRYSHDNSVFEPAIIDHITCDKFWWRNILYINNLFPQREMCMVWSWYMANDMQFYIVGIILLLISVKHPKFAMGSLGVVLVSSWATTIYISVWHQYKARIQEPFEMFDPLYDKPWSRIGPYFIGMMVGWYLQKTRCQVKMPYWLVLVGWPTALAIIGSLIFGMVDGWMDVWPTSFYVSIGHTGWGVALAWLTVSCCCGYGGLVNSWLSYRGFLPLSRLTYCAYLIHPTIMQYTSFLSDGPFHLQNSIVLTVYAGYAVMAFLASFAISLAFEAPAVKLLKIISGGTATNKNKHTQTS